MSVFRVKLQNNGQGLLDVNSLSGLPNNVSNQRTITVTGPKRIQRVLKDGETFTDCNYWKQFAYPNKPLDEAFIQIITDDGSVYSEIAEENVYPIVWQPGVAGVIGAGDSPSDDNMSLNIVETYGAAALFVQLKNTDSENDIKVKLNGNADAVFTLNASSTQIFNHGDLVVTKIEFDNSDSGTEEVDNIEVILSIKSSCLS